MRRSLLMCHMAILFFSLFSLFQNGYALGGMRSADEVRRITKEDLRALLDDPNTTIIDVRPERDWQQSERKIKGAVHEDPMQEEGSWARKYPKDKDIVLYCA